MDKPLTPNLDKMLEIKNESQAQGEFLEWLQAEKGIVLCRYVPNHEFPVHASFVLNRVLAEYHGIDYDGMEREKRALLEYIRNLHEFGVLFICVLLFVCFCFVSSTS